MHTSGVRSSASGPRLQQSEVQPAAQAGFVTPASRPDQTRQEPTAEDKKQLEAILAELRKEADRLAEDDWMYPSLPF